MQFILDMHGDEIQKTFADYQNNPAEFAKTISKNRLPWMPKTTKDLAQLMLTYQRLAFEHQQELNKDVSRKISSLPPFLDDQTAQIYQIMRDAATANAMKRS